MQEVNDAKQEKEQFDKALRKRTMAQGKERKNTVKFICKDKTNGLYPCFAIHDL